MNKVVITVTLCMVGSGLIGAPKPMFTELGHWEPRGVNCPQDDFEFEIKPEPTEHADWYKRSECASLYQTCIVEHQTAKDESHSTRSPSYISNVCPGPCKTQFYRCLARPK